MATFRANIGQTPQLTGHTVAMFGVGHLKMDPK